MVCYWPVLHLKTNPNSLQLAGVNYWLVLEYKGPGAIFEDQSSEILIVLCATIQKYYWEHEYRGLTAQMNDVIIGESLRLANILLSVWFSFCEIDKICGDDPR